MAAGSTTGTLSVCNVPIAQRSIPEPSFLYHWLSTHEAHTATRLYLKLSAMYNFLSNVQVSFRHACGFRRAWPSAC